MMAVKQRHRMAGNPYNLRKEVEISAELQLEDDSAFLNEFASRPTPGQVTGSRIGSFTESTDSSIYLDISGVVDTESDSKKASLVVKHRKHFKNLTRHLDTKK